MLASHAPLRFCADGSFRILCLSDFQETYDDFDARTLAGVNAVLDAEKPDLVILCGDNCNGPQIRSAADLKRYLDRMLEPFVRRGLPFAHVNGNHDYDAAVPMDEQMRIYQSFPGCSIDEVREGLRSEALIEGLPLPASIWNIVRFEQQMWYWNASCALQKEAGGRVPGVMAMHVSPWEFDYMRKYEAALGVRGNTDEQYGLGALNSGVFSTLVQRGDVKCVCTGHTHRNTCEAVYCGIQMCSVGSAGYSAYGEDSLRGGRIIDLSEENPESMATRMAYFRDYVK